MNTNQQVFVRDSGLDAIKALATLLVIVGHVIQYTNAEFDKSIFFKTIYSFHMPLFMFISGYLVKRWVDFDLIALKARQLVIPFLLWSALLVLSHNFSEIKDGGLGIFLTRLYQVILHPDNGGLWFLWFLFFNFLAFFILGGKFFYHYSVALIVALSILQFLDRDFTLFGLGQFRWHYFFFVFGFFARSSNFFDKIKFKKWIVLAVSLFFMTQWERGSVTSFFGVNVYGNGLPLLLGLVVKYICAVGFVIFIFSLKSNFKMNGWVVRLLSTESLGYYATQFLFIDLFLSIFSQLKSSDIFLFQLCVFISTLICCTVVVVFLRKNALLKKYFLGKLENKNQLGHIINN